MHRIKIRSLAVTKSPNSQGAVDTDVNAVAVALENIEKLSVGTGGACSVFSPMHYEPNYKYPLVVWLHENGDDRAQLQRVMPQISLRNFVGVAPDGPAGDVQSGFRWNQSDESIQYSDDAVLRAIDHAMLRFNIAPDRIFLAGAGRGGQMAFRIAFERPELFAGVISLNGSLPTSNAPLGSFQSCRDVPVFWAHSRRLQDFDESLLCQQLRLLHIAGFSVTLRQYPGDDSIARTMLSDINNWIMEMIETSVGTRRSR